jgi:hypothetical protein
MARRRFGLQRRRTSAVLRFNSELSTFNFRLSTPTDEFSFFHVALAFMPALIELRLPLP